MDFFFSNRAHALKFIDFVQGVVPIKYRHDKQLVSHNEHTNNYNYKYTFSVEIVPVCRVCCCGSQSNYSSFLSTHSPMYGFQGC